MKKIYLSVLVLMLAVCCVAQKADAALLDFTLAVPDIFSDTTGTYSYDAGTNLFTSTASAITITFDGVTLLSVDNGSYFAQFEVDESGNFVNGISGADLLITGDIDVDGKAGYEYSGTLVAGEVTDFGWVVPATGKAWFNYTFDFTSGALSSQYAAYQNLGGDEMTSEVSTFASSFMGNFGGTKVKHDTAPVTPEPASMLLLGFGLIGLAGKKIRKRFKA